MRTGGLNQPLYTSESIIQTNEIDTNDHTKLYNVMFILVEKFPNERTGSGRYFLIEYVLTVFIFECFETG